MFQKTKRILSINLQTALLTFLLFNLIFLTGCKNPEPKELNSSEKILLGGLPLYSSTLKSRAITEENKTGAIGQGGKENNGRKGAAAYLHLMPGESYTFAEIDGPGVIRHIWMTIRDEGPVKMRNMILRFYWDGQETPSVEVPIMDFFGNSHGRISSYDSEYLTVDRGGLNSFFPMPFKGKAKLEIYNESDTETLYFFYQVDYTLGDVVTEGTPYFHSQFRRVLNTTMYEDYVILDGVEGKGRFMGASVGIIDRFWEHDKNLWWGEGEVKMYIDGDTDFPTICGTGSEDYVGSAWGLEKFSTRHFGAPILEDQYISYYRFHILDPIYFSKDFKITVQQIGNDGSPDSADPEGVLKDFIAKGWYQKDQLGNGNFERVDDYCSTAYWYQTLPTKPFPVFPNKQIRSKNIQQK